MDDESRNIEGFGWRRRVGERFADDQDRQTIFAVGGSLIAGLVISITLLASLVSARGEPAEHWFDLYAGDRGARIGTADFKLRVGPFPLVICYAVGALNISALNAAYPDKDFMGRCESDSPLLTLRQMADAAETMLSPTTKETNR